MNTPPFFHSEAHVMQAGSVAFIPGWIMLLIVVFTIALLKPNFFKHKKSKVISPLLLSFVLGNLMPAYDDILAYLLGPPFAHHSLFHSLVGPFIAYVVFYLISNKKIAKYAALGNLTHIVFNFYLDWTTLFFPFTYREFGLTHIIGVHTYWIKAIHYPIILVVFGITVAKHLHSFKNKK